MRTRNQGFSLVEILVALAVMVLLLVLMMQMFNSASQLTTRGHKQLDADAEARAVLDRIQTDLGLALRHPNLDAFVKTQAEPMPGNDRMAFFSEVPGVAPVGLSSGPVSLVGLRMNADPAAPQYMKFERLSKGLPWNGSGSTDSPLVFGQDRIAGIWPTAVSATLADPTFETFAPQVFRFEYYYILKAVPARVPRAGNTPWDALLVDTASPTGFRDRVAGWRDVAAIHVAIAILDPRSGVRASSEDLRRFADAMPDYAPGFAAAELESRWNQVVTNPPSGSPPGVASAIRVYSRTIPLAPAFR